MIRRQNSFLLFPKYPFSNFRSQIEELENKHVSEVSKLQKQIDDLDNQIIRLQMSNSKNSSNANDVVNYLEREAAEGSEAENINR